MTATGHEDLAVAAGGGSAWPAALAQERHWAYHQRFPDAAGFNIPVTTWIRGQIDVGRLAEAIRQVASRHEVLRSSYRPGPRHLRQVLHRAGEVPIQQHDLRALDRLAGLTRLREIGATEAARPFRLADEPAARAHLVRLGDTDSVLVFNVHHISYDGWSSSVFHAELDDQYSALTRGSAPNRPAPRHRYVDFARWQRKRLARQEFTAQVDFWRDLLADPPPAAPWPRAGTDPAAPWWAGTMVWLRFPQRLVAAAQRSARGFGTTLFVVALSAYHLALCRLLGEPRHAVGTALAGRTHRRWEDVIGFFVNTAVLPYVLDGDATFREVVARVHRTLVQVHQNQDVPYGVLLDELAPATTAERTPYFQTLFLLQNYPSPDRKVGSAQAESRKLVTGSARYDITFSLDRLGDELTLELENRTRLVSQDTAIALARGFFATLAAAVDDPDTPVSRLNAPPVPVTVHRRPPAAAGLGELFSGLVADWRPAGDERREGHDGE